MGVLPVRGFLVLTGLKLLLEKQREVHPERNPVVRLARRVLPVTAGYEGPSFFVRNRGSLVVTHFCWCCFLWRPPMCFLPSIPSRRFFAITRDPFIIYTSNIFAIVGLRTLYFLLRVRLRNSVTASCPGVILVLVGVKDVGCAYLQASHLVSLALISLIFGSAICLSSFAREVPGQQIAPARLMVSNCVLDDSDQGRGRRCAPECGLRRLGVRP